MKLFLRIKYIFLVFIFTFKVLCKDVYKSLIRFLNISYYTNIVRGCNNFIQFRPFTKYKDPSKVRELANQIIDEGNYILSNKDILEPNLISASAQIRPIDRSQMAPFPTVANAKTIKENREMLLKFMDKVTEESITEENVIGKVILHKLKGK
ncbi:MAG: hypothetical protein KGO96_07560 [Elusimicrobia bacterium]|nr:hypothetical protein [Elusimicrobiota bacterium]